MMAGRRRAVLSHDYRFTLIRIKGLLEHVVCQYINAGLIARPETGQREEESRIVGGGRLGNGSACIISRGV